MIDTEMNVQRMIRKGSGALAIVLAGMLAGGQAWADRPDWAGGGHGDPQRHEVDRHYGDRDRGDRDRGGDRHDRPDRRDGDDRERARHFHDHDRVVVREYFVHEFHDGHCPPGLAKKHNGCRPPGHARAWAVGRPLPRDVVVYDLPPSVVIELGTPPRGYRYVRVASDILMIAVGSSMVVDAIEDLGGM